MVMAVYLWSEPWEGKKGEKDGHSMLYKKKKKKLHGRQWELKRQRRRA